MVDSEYLAEPLAGSASLRALVERLTEFLRPYANQFDTIAFRGMSGAVVAPLLSVELDKHLILVRNPSEERTHSKDAVEGWRPASRVLILDDFISSRTTVRAIIQGVRRLNRLHKIVGIVEWNRLGYTRVDVYVDNVPVWNALAAAGAIVDELAS